jgi:hypothetical protein
MSACAVFSSSTASADVATDNPAAKNSKRFMAFLLDVPGL